jgi:hypothetical protein
MPEDRISFAATSTGACFGASAGPIRQRLIKLLRVGRRQRSANCRVRPIISTATPPEDRARLEVKRRSNRVPIGVVLDDREMVKDILGCSDEKHPLPEGEGIAELEMATAAALLAGARGLGESDQQVTADEVLEIAGGDGRGHPPAAL